MTRRLRELVDRLVVHDELAPLGGAAEVRLEVETLDRGAVHLAREHACAVLAAGLGGVHREVGVAKHLVAMPAPEVPYAIPMLAVVRICNASSTTGSCSAARMRSATAVASFASFSSSMSTANSSPPSRAAVSPARRQLVSRSLTIIEQRVAGGVAEAVVDRLEVVEVDEQDRELAAVALEPRRGVVDAVAEQRLVGEPGQRVVERLVRELVLQPAVFGDVAEAPHAPDDFAVDPLRQRIAFEHAPVLELERVVAVRIGLVVELLDLGDERLGIAELFEHERERLAVVACAQDAVRDAPHLGEAGVEAGDATVAVDNEDPVGGRLEGRGQHGVRGAEIRLDRDAVADVVSGHDEPDHRRIVEQVRKRQRERDGRTAGMAKPHVDGDRRGRAVGRGDLYVADHRVDDGRVEIVGERR